MRCRARFCAGKAPVNRRRRALKLGLGLYRHMLTPDYFAFARQAGWTHVVVHLVDYFNEGDANPRGNTPTGGKNRLWGIAGDPDKLWALDRLKSIRAQIETAGLKWEAIEN